MARLPRGPASRLLALAGLLLLFLAPPPGAWAARRAERKLLQTPILRPSDSTKAAVVDLAPAPLPAPLPGDPSLTLPGGAEKCAPR